MRQPRSRSDRCFVPCARQSSRGPIGRIGHCVIACGLGGDGDFGLGLIVAKLAWLYEAIRIAGAAYLIYLGIKTLSGLRQSAQQAESASQSVVRGGVHAYRKGLLVGLTNPKAAAFFGSLFVTLLPAHAPAWVHGATLAVVVAVSLTWFCTVAVLFSTNRVQTGYAKLRKPIDAVMGTILLGLGAKLALDR